MSNAADEIQRLRKRNNYLRQELSATDYRKREQNLEIEQLRALITEWINAKDAMRQAPSSDLTHDLKAAEAEDRLRKAVGL